MTAKMDITRMQDTAEEVSRHMKALSSPTRLMLLCHLSDGEKSVGQLCALVGMKPPAASQHLTRLRQDGTLTSRRDGQTVFYKIADPNITRIMQFLYDTFCGPDAMTKGATDA
ncbi:MAG: metalloregulator ArsR/SmtB family transcription factor [Pseudomonadota bacterium]